MNIQINGIKVVMIQYDDHAVTIRYQINCEPLFKDKFIRLRCYDNGAMNTILQLIDNTPANSLVCVAFSDSDEYHSCTATVDRDNQVVKFTVSDKNIKPHQFEISCDLIVPYLKKHCQDLVTIDFYGNVVSDDRKVELSVLSHSVIINQNECQLIDDWYRELNEYKENKLQVYGTNNEEIVIEYNGVAFIVTLTDNNTSYSVICDRNKFESNLISYCREIV